MLRGPPSTGARSISSIGLRPFENNPLRLNFPPVNFPAALIDHRGQLGDERQGPVSAVMSSSLTATDAFWEFKGFVVPAWL